MKIQPYVQKLVNSSEYKKFQSEYKDAFLVAGFFVLDFESGAKLHQIDYYIPSKKKIAAFTLDNKVVLQILDTMNNKVPEKLDIKTRIDLDAIAGILDDEMKNRSITSEIRKIIAIVQNLNGKKVWNVSCVLSGMEILKSHIDDDSKTVLRMEKASILDYVKKMPPTAVPEKGAEKENAAEIDKKMKQLDKLKEALEKEKVQASQNESE